MGSSSGDAQLEAREYKTQQVSIIAIAIVTLAICLLFVGLRIMSRRLKRARLSIDDYLAIAGFIVALALVSSVLGQIESGLGGRASDVTAEDLVRQGKWRVISMYSYTLCITFVKLAILALLHRIFGSSCRVIRAFIYILAAWQIIWCIVLILIYSLGCKPFSSLWAIEKRCEASHALLYSTNVLNAVHDVVLFILPQPTIWRLRIPFKQKITGSMVMLLGLTATLMCILKAVYLHSAVTPKHDWESTHTVIPTLTFHIMEPLLALICSCIPSVRFFFQQTCGTGATPLESEVRGSRAHASHPRTVDDEEPLPEGIFVKSEVQVESSASRRGDENIGLPIWNGQ